MNRPGQAATISSLLFKTEASSQVNSPPGRRSPRRRESEEEVPFAPVAGPSSAPFRQDEPLLEDLQLPQSVLNNGTASRVSQASSGTQAAERSTSASPRSMRSTSSSSSLPTAAKESPKRDKSERRQGFSPSMSPCLPASFNYQQRQRRLSSPKVRSTKKQLSREIPGSIRMPSPLLCPQSDVQSLISPFHMTPLDADRGSAFHHQQQQAQQGSSPKRGYFDLPPASSSKSPRLDPLSASVASYHTFATGCFSTLSHHLLGFSSFCCDHARDLLVASYQATILFLTGCAVVWRTLRGKTDLGHSIRAGYANIKGEWAGIPDPQSGPLSKFKAFWMACHLAIVQSASRQKFVFESDNLKPAETDLLELERLCRFSTATYGLKMLLASPGTPLLRACDEDRLHHRIYADLSGLPDHSSILHVSLQKPYQGALSKSEEAEPWRPQFFIVRDDDREELVVVFRGTQSWHDVVMDISAMAEAFELPALLSPQSGQAKHFKCHSGMLAAARSLLQAESEFVADLSAALAAYPTHQLVLTGHSLGAGVAFVMSMMLASSRRSAEHPDQPRWTFQHPSFPHETGERQIKSVGFGSPNWCDPELGRLLARGAPSPLVTSVVIGDDLVPRFAWSQIRMLKHSVVHLADLPSTERSNLRSEWFKAMLRLSDGKQLEAHAWALRQQLLDLEEKLEPERFGPPGAAFYLDKKSTEAPWQLYRVQDDQRFFGSSLLSSTALSSHLPVMYHGAVAALNVKEQ